MSAAQAQDLLIAVEHGQLAVVQQLLDSGVIPAAARDRSGLTVLHRAAFRGHLPILALLIERGADPLDDFNECRWLPLHVAAREGREACVQLLLKSPRNVPVPRGVPSSQNSTTASQDVSTVAQHSCDTSSTAAAGSTACSTQHHHHHHHHHHQQQQHEDSWLRTAINAADLQDRTPLHLAAAEGHVEIVELLIAAGADVAKRNKGGETPLLTAAFSGAAGVVHVLLQKGACVRATDADGSTSLILAAKEGHVAAVQVLLRMGARVNAPMPDGSTALHVAAAGGCLQLVQLLLSHGAAVNAARCDGWTALHVAADAGQAVVVQQLVGSGAAVNAEARPESGSSGCARGCKPLHLAVEQGHREVVVLLLQARADVNAAAGAMQCTALHVAAGRGHGEVVEQLLAAGADAEALTHGGDTALGAAAGAGHGAVVQLLLTWRGGAGWNAGHLLKAAAKAKGSMPVWALLAGEISSRFPGAAGELIGDVGLEHAGSCIEALVGALGERVRQEGRLREEMERERAELVQLRHGVQSLIVGAAGLLQQRERQEEPGRGW